MQLLVVMLLYTACRIIFIISNRHELDVNHGLLSLLLQGARFDASSVAMTNALFVLLVLAPIPGTSGRIYRKITALLFIITNSICLLANLVDTAYFPFIHKRSQADSLLFVSGEKGNDFFTLLPVFLKEYWYLLIVFVLFTWVLALTANLYKKKEVYPRADIKHYLAASVVFLMAAGILLVALRGGLQEKPLDLIHASEVASVKNIPAVLNSPFSIIKTIERKPVEERNYFPEYVLAEFNNGIHESAGDSIFQRPNVILIIVESLSRKHVGMFGGKARTPFLDSLFKNSLVFNNGFANAKESVQGIPAILSSIPSWQNDPFIFSPYTTNKITSLPRLLKEKGYQTSFFHGGFNGTMGFDLFSRLAGVDHYYGKDEYNNNNDYDGHWGIRDDRFLKFFEGKMSSSRQPFMATLFTLNPHHPFVVPEDYSQRFNKHAEPFLNCLEYIDYSLAQFFAAASGKPWFNNTLFVITADHTAPVLAGELSSGVEDYRIPIAFYKPNSNLKGIDTRIANQIDILPSVLELMNYPGEFFSLGRNLFNEEKNRYSVNYNGGVYQYIDSLVCYQFNGKNPIGFYRWRTDSTLANNLYKGTLTAEMRKCDSALKKSIQFFNNSMVRNAMHVETINDK